MNGSERSADGLGPSPVEERPQYSTEEFAYHVSRSQGVVHAVDVRGGTPSLVSHRVAERTRRRVVHLVATNEQAEKVAADLRHWELRAAAPLAGAPDPVCLLRATAESAYSTLHADRRSRQHRAMSLHRLAVAHDWRVAVATAESLVRRTPSRATLVAAASSVAVGDEIDLRQLARTLVDAGYLQTPVVEDPGTFAVRGSLLDVWPAAAAYPVRADLLGEQLVSLRRFEPEDQRSLDALDGVVLPPAREEFTGPEERRRARGRLRSLCDEHNYPSTKARALVDEVSDGTSFANQAPYLPAFSVLSTLVELVGDDVCFVVENPEGVVLELVAALARARADAEAARERPQYDVDEVYVPQAELQRLLAGKRVVCLHGSAVVGGVEGACLGPWLAPALTAPSLNSFDQAELERALRDGKAGAARSQGLEPLLDCLEQWREQSLRVVITARTQTQAERIATLLEHRRLPLSRAEGERPGAIHIETGPLNRGFVALNDGRVQVTEEEIFGHRLHQSRRPRRKRAAGAIEDLRALAPGDHVVHVDHGVGRYEGLERQSIEGVLVELIVIGYVGGRLYLPVYRLNQVQKHSGGDGAVRLDRLGGQSFARVKAKTRRHVRQLADDLLRLHAERSLVRRPPLPARGDDYVEFEATFPFEETSDQAATIDEVMADLEREQPMDRLVCGDVGFGKTEVAVRAAFRCASAGRQVALLCPTTVLAMQHHQTLLGRLMPYGVEVRVLSRFQSSSMISDTLRGLRRGNVDVVVGTHRLLSKDVHFKNLGLLVVDEEQRFGVAHKERLKQLAQGVDLLTLSATPIPRTLQMALGGLRELSVIATPPVDRRAIRTITARVDGAVISGAVRRELDRGGQVFYVYNRVEGLPERAARLRELVPEARVAVAHGQLDERSLERRMLEFVAGEFDVLVCTAIIESGLDIARANTIIIDRADLLGLSQLYQLRGRVGRGSERAYCYLLLPAPDATSDEGRARVDALTRHSELGSGFKVASMDLELRGAGDLLGAEQSGFVASVGFELFCQMLEDARLELEGEAVVHDVDPELHLDVEALITEDYIGELGLRLSFYKRLAGAADVEDVAAIEAEMTDRFGSPPAEVQSLLGLMRLKTVLRGLKVLGCEARAQVVRLNLRDDTPLDAAKVHALVTRRASAFRLTPDGRLIHRAQPGDDFASGLQHLAMVLEALEDCRGRAAGF